MKDESKALIELDNVDYAYKYREFNLQNISALMGEYFYVSTAYKMNDPFEINRLVLAEKLCNPNKDATDNQNVLNYLKANNGNKDTIEILKNDIKEYLEQGETWDKQFNSLKNRGLYCLSKDGLNPLMWSLYSDRMEGFVIKYNLTKLLKTKNYLDGFHVKYLTDCINLPGMSDERYLYGYKPESFSVEQEIRLVYETEGKIEHNNAIEEIIIGFNMPSDHLDILKLIAKEKRIKLTTLIQYQNYLALGIK